METPPTSQPSYSGDPWQDVLASPTSAPEDRTVGPAASPPSRRGNLARAAGLILGGLLVGTVAVTLAQAASRDDRSLSTTTAATSSIPNRVVPFGAPGGRGGLAGEQRLTGTITAVGASSVTLKTSAGTATYSVDASTDIQRDGRTVALSGLKSGDAVLVHVFPQGSGYTAERVLASSSSSTGPSDTPAPQTTDGKRT